VTTLLGAAGHEVCTPTLTGLGERAHLATPQIGLETHIQDVLGMLEHDDLRDVVLVGHSYGGMVVAGVAARAPERLRHLVYLDAFVPEAGQSLWDLVTDPAARERFAGLARTEGVADEADLRCPPPKRPVAFRAPTSTASTSRSGTPSRASPRPLAPIRSGGATTSSTPATTPW
jgi:pimeloyl-ACP methyl ester carboxylesterase